MKWCSNLSWTSPNWHPQQPHLPWILSNDTRRKTQTNTHMYTHTHTHTHTHICDVGTQNSMRLPLLPMLSVMLLSLCTSSRRAISPIFTHRIILTEGFASAAVQDGLPQSGDVYLLRFPWSWSCCRHWLCWCCCCSSRRDGASRPYTASAARQHATAERRSGAEQPGRPRHAHTHTLRRTHMRAHTHRGSREPVRTLMPVWAGAQSWCLVDPHVHTHTHTLFYTHTRTSFHTLCSDWFWPVGGSHSYRSSVHLLLYSGKRHFKMRQALCRERDWVIPELLRSKPLCFPECRWFNLSMNCTSLMAEYGAHKSTSRSTVKY